MWELLTVLGIYLIVSFVGMAALWTAAVRKGAIRAPSYFFWLRTTADRALQADRELGSSNAFNFRPLGLTAATVVLLSAVSTSQLAPRGYLSGAVGPNQLARPNAIG